MSATVTPEFDAKPPSRDRIAPSIADLAFRATCRAAAFLVPALACGLLAVLIAESQPFFRDVGWHFLTQVPWNPGGAIPSYGALALIYGTVVTSAIALTIAMPLGVGAAIFLAEYAPARVRQIGSFLVELLAAIPSVVYGLWGLLVLAPRIGGPGILAAGLILAIMILPYVVAISFGVCRSAPRTLRDAALALGASRWQMVRTVVIPHARRGMIAAMFLSLGRALGETMAVTMIIGNKALSIESPIGGVGDTISSAIASQLNEATTQTQRSGLMAMALVLFLVTLTLNVLGRFLISRVGRPSDPVRQTSLQMPSGAAADIAVVFPQTNRRAAAVNSLMSAILALTVILTILPLFLILWFVIIRGSAGLSWAFFTELPSPPGQSGGGLAHAIVGSARMVALAASVAVPLGLLAGIALAEFRGGWLPFTVRFVGDLLSGVPSIIVGIYGYAVVVNAFDPPRFSAWAGSFTLAVIMLPIVMRTVEEALRTVPVAQRQASLALGAAQWQTTARVVLPAALPGIATGVILGIARIAGETAPLLLTAYGSNFFARSFDDPTPFLPKYVYHYATSGFANQERQAWAAALVLLAFVVALNLGIRWLAQRSATASDRTAG